MLEKYCSSILLSIQHSSTKYKIPNTSSKHSWYCKSSNWSLPPIVETSQFVMSFKRHFKVRNIFLAMGKSKYVLSKSPKPKILSTKIYSGTQLTINFVYCIYCAKNCRCFCLLDKLRQFSGGFWSAYPCSIVNVSFLFLFFSFS